MDDVMTSRIDALEIKVAHQETTIDDLNATITAQWRKIDALAREMASLTDRLQDLSRREPGEAEPPPPHY
jgi:SlyX protein